MAKTSGIAVRDAEDNSMRASPTVAAPKSRSRRGKQADSDARTSDGTVMTPAERRAMLRSEWTQSALPNAPDIPGFHTCWLSTNSSYDPLHKRLKLGYQLVRRDEVKHFSIDPNLTNKSKDYQEYVTCVEMILAKIDMDTYHEVMQMFHHDMPLEQEASIRRQQETVEEQHGMNAPVTEIGDGTVNVVQKRRAPKVW